MPRQINFTNKKAPDMAFKAFNACLASSIVLASCAGRRVDGGIHSKPGESGVSSQGPILGGRITDENGDALPGVKVRLYGGLATRWEGQSTETDSNGVYRFDPLETGARTHNEATGAWDYYVGVRLEHPTHISIENQAWWDLIVDSTPAKVTTRDFHMMTGGRLIGSISTADGFAWREMSLRLTPLTAGHAGTGWYATTDQMGRFETQALTPGEYAIEWNDTHADYPQLARVRIEPGGVTNVDVVVTVRVEAKDQQRPGSLNDQ